MEKRKRDPATAAKQRYNEKAYDRLSIWVERGKRDEIAAVAKSTGESLNGFVKKAIDKAMEEAQK